MKRAFKRILVAVRSIEGLSRATLGKTAALAQGSGANVELFHAVTDPELIETVWRDRSGRAPDAIYETIVAKTCSRLERLARSAALAHVKVNVHANWDAPAYEAIVRRALAVGADLAVVEAPRYGPELQPFLRHTDWQLVLHCPCPVLLTRAQGRYDRANVLVAIDPGHAADPAADLDRRMLEVGKQLAGILRGELHACQVYLPIASRTLTPALRRQRSAVDVELPPKPSVRAAFERLASRCGVDPNHRHLCPGRVSLELARIARKVRARILVMGALSRSGGPGDFIGDTAQRVLERVSCDVLVIKPVGFRTSVSKRALLRPGQPG